MLLKIINVNHYLYLCHIYVLLIYINLFSEVFCNSFWNSFDICEHFLCMILFEMPKNVENNVTNNCVTHHTALSNLDILPCFFDILLFLMVKKQNISYYQISRVIIKIPNQ